MADRQQMKKADQSTTEAAAITIPLDLLKRLVGAAAGIAPDREAVDLARATIVHAEAAFSHDKAA